MRKTLSVIFALLMILSLSCLTVGAADNQVSVTSGGVTTEYADYKDGFKAAKAGDTITLLKDITLYGSESLTIAAGSDLTVNGNGHTIFSPYNCFYCVAASESKRTKLTLRNLTVDATQNSGKSCVQIKGYIDLLIDGCTFKSSNDGVETSGPYSVVTIKNSSLYSTKRYGIKAHNCNTYVLENTKIESSEGACIEVYSGYTPAGELTLTNCEFTGTGNFCLWLHDLTKVTINGGTYTTVGNAKKPAAIYIDGDGCDVTVKGGTFNCNQTSAISLLSPAKTSKLTISGGTFNYTGAGAGSALVASGGILNITGGTFVSNGTDAVINVVNDEVTATVEGATATNSGTASIPAYSKNGQTVTAFPAGQKTVTIGSAPVTTETSVTTADPESTTTPSSGNDNPPSTGDYRWIFFAIAAVMLISAVRIVLVADKKKN